MGHVARNVLVCSVRGHFSPDIRQTKGITVSETTTQRRCSSCKRTKPSSAFGADPYRCLECTRARIRDWRARKRAERTDGSGDTTTTRPSQMAAARAPSRDRAPREIVLSADLARVIERYLRVRPDESHTSLATRAGVDRHTVREIVTGQRRMTSLVVADRLCVAMGIHVDIVEPRAA